MSEEKPTDEPPKEPLCPCEPDLTQEEVARRIAEPGGMPLAEFRFRLVNWINLRGVTMVALYVDGTKVGTLTDAERIVPDLLARSKVVELRDEQSGRIVGRLTPEAGEPLVPWNPSITKAELDRRAAEPGGMSLDEFWKSMGVR